MKTETPLPEIKPCPFCGEQATLVEFESSPNEGPGPGYVTYRVVCAHCRTIGPNGGAPITDMDGGGQKAIELWNRRPTCGRNSGLEVS